MLCCDITYTLWQPRVDGYLYDTVAPLAMQTMHSNVRYVGHAHM